MTRKYLHFLLLTALLISLCQLIFNPFRSWNRIHSLSVGQVAEQDIVSPLEFSVQKSRELYLLERKAAEESVTPIYKVSDNITFNAIRNLDVIIRHFENSDSLTSWQKMQRTLQQKGYKFSAESIMYLMDHENLVRVYEHMSEKIARILDIGIYPESYSDSRITVRRKGKIKEYYLFKLYAYDEAREKIIDGFPDADGKSAIADIADNILVVNIVLDKEATEGEKQKAGMQVSRTAGKVLRNETIIRKGERVDEQHMQKLESLLTALKNTEDKEQNRRVILSLLGTFILVTMLMLIFFRLLEQYKGRIEISVNHLLVLLSLFFVESLLALFISNILGQSLLFLPVSFFIFAVIKLINRQAAFLFTFTQFLLVSLLMNLSFNNPFLLSVSTLSVLVITDHNKVNYRYLNMAVSIFLFYLLLVIGLSLHQLISLAELFQRIWKGAASIGLSTILAIILIPYLEKRFKIVTRDQLLELLNLEHPLLKRLNKEIPGTYHHSLVVGNLAESAAEAIGANHLLARVGSYYHDIGKLVNSHLFIENNFKASELHEDMLPTQSAQIIRSHLVEGVKLAREAGLPEAVIDVILQHHGTSKIRFFLNKAQENNLEYEAEEFQYPGPKPQTREAAIIMIADIVESRSKSLTEINEDVIEHLLDDTINKLLKDGQLFEAPLTLSDLRQIKHAMYPILLGVYSTRVEYPKDESESESIE